MLKLADQILLSYSCGRPCCYFNRMYDFSVSIPRSYKDVYVSSTFSHTVRLLNFLHAKLFPLIYDLNGFMPRVNWHIFGFFLNTSLEAFFFFHRFLATSYLVVVVKLFMEWIPVRKWKIMKMGEKFNFFYP